MRRALWLLPIAGAAAWELARRRGLPALVRPLKALQPGPPPAERVPPQTPQSGEAERTERDARAEANVHRARLPWDA